MEENETTTFIFINKHIPVRELVITNNLDEVMITKQLLSSKAAINIISGMKGEEEDIEYQRINN